MNVSLANSQLMETQACALILSKMIYKEWIMGHEPVKSQKQCKKSLAQHSLSVTSWFVPNLFGKTGVFPTPALKAQATVVRSIWLFKQSLFHCEEVQTALLASLQETQWKALHPKEQKSELCLFTQQTNSAPLLATNTAKNSKNVIWIIGSGALAVCFVFLAHAETNVKQYSGLQSNSQS